MGILALLLGGGSAATVLAGSQNVGADFLRIGVGARSAGMGSAFTATADDPTAMYWNPAGLARMTERQIAAAHAEWLSDLSFDFVGGAMPTRWGAIGANAVYLSQGDLKRTDATGADQGAFGAYDAALGLSLARTLSARATAGGTVKFVQQGIDDEKASGFALDMGYQYQHTARWAFGAAVQNLGADLKFVSESYRLPLSVAFGAGYTPLANMTVAADLRHEVYVGATSLNLGSEYWAMNTVALRAGYNAPMSAGDGASAYKGMSDGTTFDAFTGLNMGLGLKLSRYQVDYALVPYGDLGSTHRLSFAARF
jgi:hypothetical protein